MGMHTLDRSLRLNKIHESINNNNLLLELLIPRGGTSQYKFIRAASMRGAAAAAGADPGRFGNKALIRGKNRTYGGEIERSGALIGRNPNTGQITLPQADDWNKVKGTIRQNQGRSGNQQSQEYLKKYLEIASNYGLNQKRFQQLRAGQQIKDFTQAHRDISLLTGGKSPQELATQAKQFAEYQKTQALAKRQKIVNVLKGGAKIGLGAATLAGVAALAPVSVPAAVGGLVGAKTAMVGLGPALASLGLGGIATRSIGSGIRQVGANIGVPRIPLINTAEGKRTNFYGKPLVGVPQIDRAQQLRKARETAARSETLSVNPGQQMTGRQIYANIRNNPSLARRYREDLVYRQDIDRQTSRADYRQDVGFAQAVTPDILKGQFAAMQKKVNLIKSGERKLINPIPGVSPEKQFLTVGQGVHMALKGYAQPVGTPSDIPNAERNAEELGMVYTKSASQMTPANWEIAAKHGRLAKGSYAHSEDYPIETAVAPMVRIPGANKGQSVTQFSHALHPDQLRDVAAQNRAAVNAALTAAHGAATDPNSPIAQRAVQAMLSGVRRSQPKPVIRNTVAPTSSVGTT